MDANENVTSLPSPQTHAGGRPCEYCKDKDSILLKAREYIDSGIRSEKPRPLFLNELAVVILHKDRDRVTDWANKKNEDGELEHPEFYRMIKELEQIQEMQLQKRILGRFNPTGAIFLLKTKHGYVETEKKIVDETKTVNLNVNALLTKVYDDTRVIEPDSTT